MILIEALETEIQQAFDVINNSAKPELCSRVWFWNPENIILVTPYLLKNNIPYTVAPSANKNVYMLTIYDKNKS